MIAKKFVKDVKNTWKANLPPEVNSKNIVKLLSSNSEDGSFDILCALEIVCVTVGKIYLSIYWQTGGLINLFYLFFWNYIFLGSIQNSQVMWR